MATTLQFIAYDTTSLSGLVGSARELYVDTSKATVVVMDGVTPGGSPLVTERSLSSQLTSYSTLSYVTSLIVSYTTNDNLTSTLASYPTNTNLTSTLTNYPTNANLTSTLTNYPTNANLTSTLTNYPTNASLTSTLTNYLTSSYLTSYVTNANLTSTLSSYVTNSNLSSQLTSYATLTYVNNLNNQTDVIEPLSLPQGFLFYSGTSATSLSVGTSFSSVSVISDSIIRMINPTPSTITSVTEILVGSTLIINYSSQTHLAEVLSTPSYSPGNNLFTTFFTPGNASGSYTLSSTGTTGATKTVKLLAQGFPGGITLVETTDYTIVGSNLTINNSATVSGTSAFGIQVSEDIGVIDINYSSNTINNTFNFTSIGIGYDTSSTTYNGSDPGFLTYTNPNGVQYFSDGRIEYPNNLVFNSSGTIVLPAGGQVLDNTGNTIGITINDVNNTVSSTLATYPFTTENIVFGDGFYLYNATSSVTYNASTTSGGLYYDATIGFDEFSVFVAGNQSPTLINTLSSLASTSLISCDINGYTFFYSLDDTRTTGFTEIAHINAWVADELNLGQTSLVIIGPDVRYNNVISQVVSNVTSTETLILYPSYNYRLIKNGSAIQSGNAGATVSFDVSNGDWYLLQSVTSGTSITISVGKDGKFGSPGFVVAQNSVNYNVTSFTIGYQSVQYITGATSITVVSGQTVQDSELEKFGDIRQSTATGSTLVIDFNFPTNYIYQDENVTNLTFLSLPPPGKSISTEVFIRQTTTGNTFNVSAGPSSGVTISITPNSNSNVSGLTDIFRFTAVNTTIGPVPPATTSIIVYGTGLYKGI